MKIKCFAEKNFLNTEKKKMDLNIQQKYEENIFLLEISKLFLENRKIIDKVLEWKTFIKYEKKKFGFENSAKIRKNNFFSGNFEIIS